MKQITAVGAAFQQGLGPWQLICTVLPELQLGAEASQTWWRLTLQATGHISLAQMTTEVQGNTFRFRRGKGKKREVQ